MSLSPRDDEPDDHVRPGGPVDDAATAADASGDGLDPGADPAAGQDGDVPGSGPVDHGSDDAADDAAGDAADDAAGAAARAAAEAAAWDAIVANYGERPRWDPPATPAPDRAAPHPDHPAGRGRRRRDQPGDEVERPRPPAPPDDSDLARGADERFVPPPPGPLPRTTPARLLAWLGLLAVPLAVVVLALAEVPIPMWGETLLIAWFVGGFTFLVASMRRQHDDPDDGAVL